ncbi:MAG: serine hydrolase, partial [Candidatus Bruticola sp.]
MNKYKFYALSIICTFMMILSSAQSQAEPSADKHSRGNIPQPTQTAQSPEEKLKPVNAERLKKVQELLQAQVKAYPSLDIGYSVVHIPTSAKLSHQGSKQFPLASVFKIPVLIETCLQLQNDTLPFNTDKQLTIKKDDYCIGSGELIDAPVNSKITLDKVLTLMITISDNTATDMLIHLIGADSLGRLMRDLQLHDNSIFMSNRQAWLICLGQSPIFADDNPEKIAHIWKGLTLQQRLNLAKEVEEANKDLNISQFQAMEDRSGVKYGFSQQRIVAETVDNQSSPDDFSQLMAKLWRQEILSP